MSQMKSLARTLTAQITEKSGKLTQLELLPQPLHRYASPQNDILDGAIFAMAFGTDPEVYLFIEDFLENNQRKWRYSPVRSHYLKLAVNENDTEVWRVDENLRLEATNADETELSREPFFVYNLPYPIPKPEELRLETPTPAKQ